MLAFATALGPNDVSMDFIPTKAMALPYATSIWPTDFNRLFKCNRMVSRCNSPGGRVDERVSTDVN